MDYLCRSFSNSDGTKFISSSLVSVFFFADFKSKVIRLKPKSAAARGVNEQQ